MKASQMIVKNFRAVKSRSRWPFLEDSEFTHVKEFGFRAFQPPRFK